MTVKGCNKFKIPHMQKEKLEKEDRLLLQISCEAYLLAKAIASLPAWNHYLCKLVETNAY